MKNVIDKIVQNTYRLIFGDEPAITINRFARDLSFVAVGFGISAILGLATQIMAGRILGPLEYGKYSLIQAVSFFISFTMLLGVATALIKYSSEKSNFDDRQRIISTSYLLFIFLAVVSSIFLSIFYNVISSIFGIPAELLIYAIIFSLLASSYTISVAIAQGLKEMKVLSILQIIYGISGFLTFLFLIYLKVFTFQAILLASSINYFIVFVLTAVVFRKYLSFNFDKILAKKILKYGFFASMGLIAYVVYSNFDRLIINKFLGASAVGVYGSYYVAFIASAGFIFSIFNLVFFPMVSGIKDKEAILKKINRIVPKLSLFAALPVLLFGIVVLKLYGDRYQLNFWLCLLFDIASVLSVINGIYVWYMNATGERGIKITAIAAILAAIVNVVINISLIPIIGFLGAAIASILAYIISIFITLYYKKGCIVK